MALAEEEHRSAMSVALAYAHRGIAVFPCNPLDKTPLVKTGFKAATTDPERVKLWWLSFPNAMVGAPTGKANGFVVLDIDNNVEKEKYGLASIAEFGHPFEELADGPHTQTTGGGYHVFYRYDEQRPLTNARGRLPTFVDIRGDGGYVILAGSRSAEGRAYRAVLSLADCEPPEAPAWLYEALSGSSSGFDFNTASRQADNAARRAFEIPPGQWHEKTRDFVARMVREGSSDETIATVAPGFTTEGYEHSQTINEFLAHARTAREKWGYQPRQAESESRFRLLSVNDLAELKAPEWRIDGIFPTHGTSTIYGPFGSFKSFVALDMALSLSTGRPWHGREVKECPVLYVAGEGQFGLAPRVLGWLASKQLDRADAFKVIAEAVAIPVRGETDALLRAIEASGISFGLVVFDTITRMSGGGSLNDEKDVQAYVRASDRIRTETGAHVMHIGHTGKNTDLGLMGSVVLPGAMETIIAIERQAMSVTLVNDHPRGKQKDGPAFEDLRFALRDYHFGDQSTLILTPDTDIIREKKGEPGGPLQVKILAAVQEANSRGGLGLTSLAALTGSNSGTLMRTLTKMEEKGLIRRAGEEGGLRWFVVL